MLILVSWLWLAESSVSPPHRQHRIRPQPGSRSSPGHLHPPKLLTRTEMPILRILSRRGTPCDIENLHVDYLKICGGRFRLSTRGKNFCSSMTGRLSQPEFASCPPRVVSHSRHRRRQEDAGTAGGITADTPAHTDPRREYLRRALGLRSSGSGRCPADVQSATAFRFSGGKRGLRQDRRAGRRRCSLKRPITTGAFSGRSSSTSGTNVGREIPVMSSGLCIHQKLLVPVRRRSAATPPRGQLKTDKSAAPDSACDAAAVSLTLARARRRAHRKPDKSKPQWCKNGTAVLTLVKPLYGRYAHFRNNCRKAWQGSGIPERI